ncbi:hypothetical protein SDRG_05237 [Saprolegnia diclina VS20]|uniref:Tyrosine-protein kinase ephrin type A/B receptor-like domain-containing protein n=1 Tax=Saprolegnia diclina (strain VS20) TaxID=1156394 RepID=T0QSG4_SAPDV|nr:hypothetical protein SDRG_05237 [Saprolegnia diclina VS20]EQC37646.1 hypothetical protein SDRG_05237 [Saprolegnia diclina VS20]|eukprot:XP_008609166.1 hypothetical protein SDRG_05237 [Saprolegnia diclina VS20]
MSAPIRRLWGLVLLLWTTIPCVAQACSLSAIVADTAGVIRDRTLQGRDNYETGIHCHWQIATSAPGTIVELTFTLLNLVARDGESNDVVLVNLGLGAVAPAGWRQYTRPVDLQGFDGVGSFAYATSSLAEDTCNQSRSFDSVLCDLTYGSLLTDTARSASWIYFSGKDVGGAISMLSTAPNVYVIYRSFLSTSPGAGLDSSSVSGMMARYEFVHTLCSSDGVVSPQLSVAYDTTPMQRLRYFSHNKPYTTCSWLLQPRRFDAATGNLALFDSIWLHLGSLELLGVSEVTIYDGASTNATVLAKFSSGSPSLPTSFLQTGVGSLQTGQGSLFLTFAFVDGIDATGFSMSWQAGTLCDTRGGRRLTDINDLMPRQYYVAPSSYAPSDGASGLGTRESPFTSSFAYLFENVLRDGDMLTLFPGRYQGTGYCGLTFPTSIYVTSLSGPAWTLVACQGISRGWLLTHTKGLSVIRGLSFTGCATPMSPLFGVALYIGGNASIENCRFYGNQFAGQGTVAVVAPSVTTLRGCTFDSNVATVGAAVAVLSATAILDNCTIHANNATLSGAVFVSTSVSTSTTLHNPSTVTISACTFTRNFASSVVEAALTANQASVVTIVNSTFRSNLGGAIGLDAAYATINNSVITGNAGLGVNAVKTQLHVSTTVFGDNKGADKGGGLRAETSTVRSVSNMFTGNAAVVAGGGVYLLNSSFEDAMSVYKSNTVGTNADATNRGLGGALYALNCYDTTTLQPLIVITNGTFQANKALFGGAVYLEQSYTLLQQSVFQWNKATTFGGALMVTTTRTPSTRMHVLLLDSNLYDSNSGGSGGGSLYVSSSDSVSTTNDVFVRSRSYGTGGAIMLVAALVSVKNGTFLETSSTTDGGAIYADSTSGVFIVDSNFTSCVAYRHGGSVYVSSQLIVIINVTMTNSMAFKYGGSVVIQSVTQTAYFRNIAITTSSASKGGAFYIIDSTISETIFNVSITNTTARTMGGAMYLVLANLTIDHLTTNGTMADIGGMMSLEESVVVLSNASIVKATATASGGAFYSIISNLTLQSSVVDQHSASANGGAIYGFSSTVMLRDTRLAQNSAAAGGAIAVVSSTVNALRANFAHNRALTGGALSADLSHITLDTSVLDANAASGLGGALAVSFNSLTLLRSLLRDNVAAVGGAISVSNLAMFNLSSSRFDNNSVLSTSSVAAQGGAISITTITNASFVTNCSFHDNRAEAAKGGAIYTSMGSALTPPTISIDSSIFEQSRSGYGGALYLENAPTFLSRSRWTNNMATTGGGGGIYWTGNEPQALDSQEYINNYAVYGPNVASLPHGLQPHYTPPPTDGVTTGETSGQVFAGTLVVHVVDKYGQVVTTDNETQVALTSLTTSALIAGVGKATAVRGICNFSSSGVQFTPGFNMTLAVTGGGLVPQNNVEVHLRRCVRGEVLPQGVAQCIKCPVGQFSWNASEMACQECPNGAICSGGDSIQAKDGYWRFPNSTGVCTSPPYDGCSLKECLASACNGLLRNNYLAYANPLVNGTMSLILPSNASGYEVNDTLYVEGATYSVVGSSMVSLPLSTQLQLFVTGSTPLPNTGSVAIYKVQPETCKPGFTGHLCFKCAHGYTRSGKTDCAACPSNYTLTVLVLIGGVVLCVGYATILIMMAINKSRTKIGLLSILTKILTSHVQLVGLAGSFDLPWPDIAASMFTTQSAAFNPAGKLISINCLLSRYKAQLSPAATSLSPYYEQLLMYLCLPLLCIVAPIAFWQLKCFFAVRRIERTAWPARLRANLDRGPEELVLDTEIEDILRAVGEDPSDIVLLDARSIEALAKEPQPLCVVKAAYLDAVRPWIAHVLSRFRPGRPVL